MTESVWVGKKSVFLVDDHPLVREWLTQLINNETDLHVCGQAENATDTIDKMHETNPDLAVVDISLPGVSGLDLIKQIRQLFPKTFVVVLSMHEEGIYAERALRVGARGYVIKRETSEQITVAIRRVLAGGIYLSENMALGLAENLVKRADSRTDRIEELLSDREIEIFELLGQGRKTAQIADLLTISLKTVHSYCARIKEKLNLSNSTELLREAVCWYEQEKKGV